MGGSISRFHLPFGQSLKGRIFEVNYECNFVVWNDAPDIFSAEMLIPDRYPHNCAKDPDGPYICNIFGDLHGSIQFKVPKGLRFKVVDVVHLHDWQVRITCCEVYHARPDYLELKVAAACR